MYDWKSLWCKFGALAISFLNSFAVAGIFAVISMNVGVLDMQMSDWKVVANAAIAAALMTMYKALNPNYTAYGIGSIKE